jgi:hypothetical protein
MLLHLVLTGCMEGTSSPDQLIEESRLFVSPVPLLSCLTDPVYRLLIECCLRLSLVL